MIRILALMLSITLAGPSFAQEKEGHADHTGHGHHDHDQTDNGDGSGPDQPIEQAVAAGGSLVDVDVLGMVCDFCATALTKTFGRHKDVAAVRVDLDTKRLSIVVKKGHAMDDETITRLVEQAGYKVQSITRADSAADGSNP